jgi:hypothetical protein
VRQPQDALGSAEPEQRVDLQQFIDQRDRTGADLGSPGAAPGRVCMWKALFSGG